MIKNKLASVLTVAVFALSSLGMVANAAVTEQQKTEIKQQLEQIKKLPKEQRKAKVQELKAKYPDAFKHKKHGEGFKKLKELAKNNPQLAAELKQIKELPKDQRRAKMKEIKEKYLKG